MARIRTVKPEFWTDEKLTECSLSARLLFIGLLNFSDDNGNMVLSIKRIKMQVFPADSIDVGKLINELLNQGVLSEYSVSNKKYLHIKGFKQHQRINRPSGTNIPTPDLNDDSVSTHAPLTDGREGKGREGINTCSSLRSELYRFEEFWAIWPKRKNRPAAIKAWKKIKPNDDLFEKIVSAIKIQKAQSSWLKDKGQFIPYPSTWLNGEGWNDEIAVANESSTTDLIGGGTKIHFAGGA